MVEWWQLVFVLIVVAAYVIRHIVAAQQEEQAARGRSARPLQPVVTKSDEEQARAKTELDRRIDEALERRREPDERPIALPLPRRAIPMPVPTEMKPLPRSRPPRPAPVKPSPPVAAPPPARTVAAVVEKVTVLVEAPAMPITPAVRTVIDLLRDRRNLAAAVVLREILDRPLSRRRRV
jgi:hypothetical protein